MSDYRPRSKVWAGSAGAGFGASIGMALSDAEEISAFLIDAFSLNLTEAGLRGLITLVTMTVVGVSGAVGSFLAGYMKTERIGAFR